MQMLEPGGTVYRPWKYFGDSLRGVIPKISGSIHNLSTNTWSDKASTPSNVNTGETLSDYIGSGNIGTALKGSGKSGFLGFTTIFSNSWSVKADAPGEVGNGGALAYIGHGNISAFRGGNTPAFWIYNISLPIHGQSRRMRPDNVEDGGAIAYDKTGHYIYAFNGANTRYFLRYTISNNIWSVEGKQAPGNIGAGGFLVSDNRNYIYAFNGANTPMPEVHDRMVGTRGAFAQTVRGLQNVLSSRLYVMTNTTMLRTNIHSLPETLDFLSDLGVPTVGLNALIHSGRGATVGTGLPESELTPLLDLARRKIEMHGQRLIWYTPTQYCNFDPMSLDLGVKGCTAALYNMCVEPNGNVLPCQSYYHSLGNLLADDWGSIWEHPLALRLRERQGLPQKCDGCALLAECGGGCPLQFELQFESVESATQV